MAKKTVSETMEEWSSQYPSVTAWLAKLQDKKGNAVMLHEFCKWSELDPEGLLALKQNGDSLEAEKILDYFAASKEFIASKKYKTVTAIKSFFKHNYRDLASLAGSAAIRNYQTKEQRMPTKETLFRLRDWCGNPRDRSIISLAASSAIALDTLSKLKWKHLEDGWEDQEIPHISIPPELLKGHGRGKYRGVRQETFLTPEAKKDLKEYKKWMERKSGKRLRGEDSVYLSIVAPFERMAKGRISTMVHTLSEETGILFGLHDCRRYVQTALETVGTPSNWIKKVKGRKARGEEAPYSKPSIEQLRDKYREALGSLQFVTKTVAERETDSETRRKLAEKILAEYGFKPGEMAELMRSQTKRIKELETWMRRQKDEEEPRETKIIAEEEAENHLNHGWKFKASLNSGKVLVERRTK